ncbi:MAG: hypothetical protein K2G37_05625 [Clostridia bacterium]|nr:hypothetical protein [Clostridia bacterium]MDE7329453.1 hypothetical protein [Clostridia bacterium]
MKRILLASVLFICCICLAVLSAQIPESAAAENVDVIVNLNDDSLLASCGEDFAYTNGKTVCVAKNNTVFSYLETQSFDKFVSLAMDSKHIVAIAKKGGDSLLFVYSYDERGIDKVGYTNSNLRTSKLIALYSDENGEFYVSDNAYIRSFEIENVDINTLYTSGGLFSNVEKFAVTEDEVNRILYALVDGDFYKITMQSLDDIENLDEFLVKTGNYTDLTIVDGALLVADETGVYSYNAQDGSFQLALETGVDANSRISVGYEQATARHWVYVKSDLNAVNVYSYEDGALNYYSTFDKTKYVHPTEFEEIAVYKTASSIILYSSPKHLQTLATLPANEYILVLTESGDFYYVYFYDETLGKAIFGYIKKQSDVTLCPADSTPSIGIYAQPLHPETPIYKYPTEDKEINKPLKYSTIYDQLVVINDVGSDGDFSWGWYKVGYLENNEVVYGYVRALNVSPYTQLHAPDLSKTAKLTEHNLGEYVKIYSLPLEDSAIVAEVSEGTQVYLKNKFDKNSEWTAIIYENKVAYVKTINVQPEGLTSWQIALAITIPTVVVAIVIVTIILVVIRKRKLSYKI